MRIFSSAECVIVIVMAEGVGHSASDFENMPMRVPRFQQGRLQCLEKQRQEEKRREEKTETKMETKTRTKTVNKNKKEVKKEEEK